MLLFSSLTGGISENEKNSCFCERHIPKKKRSNKGRNKIKEKPDTPPVMFLSALVRIIATLVFLIRRRFGLIRKKVCNNAVKYILVQITVNFMYHV